MKEEQTELMPDAYLSEVGRIFAVFGEQTQDSGNVSYGVEVGPDRYFVKTAGRPDNPRPFLTHSDRVALLGNAVRLAGAIDHPALPALHRVIASPVGPMLVYQWVEGILVRSVRDRFWNLPTREIVSVLDTVYQLHDQLARSGWIAADFYDGCLIYDFERCEVAVIDLDHYCETAFTNEMGRMFGSTRFMATEEFEYGATIDQRTTVFTLGRTAAVFLSDGSLNRAAFRGSDLQHEVLLRACRDDRSERFGTVAEFYSAWLAAGTVA